MGKWLTNLASRSEIRFLFVGGFNTVVSYLLFLLLDHFLTYQTAYACAFVCGVILNFFTHKYVTFRSKGSIKTELPKFVLIGERIFAVYENLGREKQSPIGLSNNLARVAKVYNQPKWGKKERVRLLIVFSVDMAVGIPYSIISRNEKKSTVSADYRKEQDGGHHRTIE
jgi:hypothetical protein